MMNIRPAKRTEKLGRRRLTVRRCTVVFASFFGVCLSSRSLASTMGGEAESANLRTLIQAREIYALSHHTGGNSPGPALGPKQRALIDHLQRLSEHNPTAASIRRL